MTRATKKDIEGRVRVINNILAGKGYFHKLYAEWAYGRPRVYLLDENKCPSKELSPRLRTGLLVDWLDAFYEGLVMGLMDEPSQVKAQLEGIAKDALSDLDDWLIDNPGDDNPYEAIDRFSSLVARQVKDALEKHFEREYCGVDDG